MSFQGKGCYVCGSVEDDQLLANCTKCKSVFIHVYCMKTIEYIHPDHIIWVCEDCEPPPKHVASRLTDEVQVLKRPVKFIPIDEVRVLKRPIKFIPTNEAIALASHSSLPKGGDSRKDTLKASKKAGEHREQRPSDGQLEIDRSPPNPVSYAAWKGCLSTSGFPVRSLDVLGYPPVKIVLKAYEFAKKMPNALHFEAIPRRAVWAKMFKDGGPNKYDIGLYFLPVANRSEQFYSCLVAHLEKQDIVLKARIDKVQLLILSSSHLDEDSKKINKAYYLWGLFVSPAITFKELGQKQFPSKTNIESSIQQQAVEMEIDMQGGASVGRTDIPIPRNSHLNSSKKSPAAVAASQPVPEPVPVAHVKPENWDRGDLIPPPPGFEEIGRLKYKTISELLQSGNGRRS